VIFNENHFPNAKNTAVTQAPSNGPNTGSHGAYLADDDE